MSTLRPTSRGRRERLGADAARVWARELVLGNPYAKSVLLAVANYMNEDGTAWPGIVTIARDTDIGEETVIKRLRWLEAIGAIALLKCWVDENGRRNHDARGRPTSSEIRFLFDADIDAIEQAAKEAVEPRALRGAALAAHSAKVSTRPHGELDSDQHPASTPLAPCQPSTPAGPYIEEKNLEPELEPPNPPSGGEREAIDQDLENDISEFTQAYPGPITDLPRLRTVFSAMAPLERRKVLTAVVGYANFIRQCEARGKSRAIKDAHRWVSGGQWQGYLPAGERASATAQAATIPINSPAGKALEALHRVARIGKPFGSSGNYFLSRPLSPRGLAFAQAPPESQWEFISDRNPQQCGAWNEFIGKELAGKPRPPLISDRVRTGQRGFLAPWPWPPLKDGSLCTGPPAANQDDKEFIERNEGLG